MKKFAKKLAISRETLLHLDRLSRTATLVAGGGTEPPLTGTELPSGTPCDSIHVCSNEYGCVFSDYCG